MKTLSVALLVLFLAAPFSQAEGARSNFEIAGIGTIYVPQDDDLYDGGAGVEIQARFWPTPYIGAALAFGSATWAINEQDLAWRQGDVAAEASLDDYVDLTPIGVSLLLRPIDTSRVSLTLEGGARYVIVDSQAEVKINARGPDSRIFVRDTLDIDDGIVAVAAATLDIKLNSQVSLLGGAGYQFDLQKGDITMLGESFGHNKLESLLIQAGVAVRF